MSGEYSGQKFNSASEGQRLLQVNEREGRTSIEQRTRNAR